MRLLGKRQQPPGIDVDTGAWPVVHVIYRVANLKDDDVTRFHADLDRMLTHAGPFVTIIDTTRLRWLPGPRLLRNLEAWVERNQEVLAERSCGTVTITKSALARGVAQWILHQRKVRTKGAVVSSVDEAVEWAMQRLKERGIRFDRAIVSRLLLSGEASQSVIEPVVGEIDAERRALTELLMGAFSEPAFLVDESGTVVFMNAPAEEAFGAPPRWLGSALDQGHLELKALCRIVPLAIGKNLFLVIPDAELVPVDDKAPPELELPEGLSRVAAPLAQGLSDREISDVTGLSHATVRTYVQRIFQRTGVRSRGAFIRQYAAPSAALRAGPPRPKGD